MGVTAFFFKKKEHFLENLPYLLETLISYDCIGKCYFQNPPISFLEGLRRISDGNLVEESHFYEEITKDHLLSLYNSYKEEIKGQSDTLMEILSTLYPLTKGNDEKPVVMMFYGPAGVGKTESAKIINNKLTNGELFRQQLSMYQTSDFLSYFLGSSLEEPCLARDLLNRASNVILFDEFNRCSPAIYSAFFQMFDEGVYIDKNYEVNLKNTVIICTANYDSKEQILDALGGALFSRFDHFVRFNHLSIETKKSLIREKYIEILPKWNTDEGKILEDTKHIEALVKNAEFFTNVRNIEKGVENYMSKILVKYMIEENSEIINSV